MWFVKRAERCVKKQRGGAAVGSVVHSKGALMSCRSPFAGMILGRAHRSVGEIASDADVNYRADVAGIMIVR